MREEGSASKMAENMNSDDTISISSESGHFESNDYTSNDNATEDGFYSDDDFISDAQFVFEDKCKCRLEKNNNNLEVEFSLPEEEMTLPEENDDNVIAKARSFFLTEFKPLAWFQKKWGTVHAIECIVPVVGNQVKKSFAAQKKLFEDAGKNVEERLLFHGTSLESVNGIAENNFDISAVPSSHERGKAMYLGRGVYFSEAPTVSLGYGSSLLVCQVLPGKTEHLANREAADHPIAREVWDSRQVRAGKVWVIPAASQILPFCVIHCYFHPAGLPNILSGATSRAAGALALQESRSRDRPRARDPDSYSSRLIRK